VKNISAGALQKEERADVRELRRAMQVPNVQMAADPIVERMTRPQLEKSIAETTRLMKEAAKNLDFLQAAQYRDEIIRLQKELELK
jgi:excinuclease ABC subunit B